MAVRTSDAASIVRWQVLDWCGYRKEELIAFFASGFNNFLLFGKDCLVDELRDVGTNLCHSKHYALAST
jgi:tryptophanase